MQGVANVSDSDTLTIWAGPPKSERPPRGILSYWGRASFLQNWQKLFVKYGSAAGCGQGVLSSHGHSGRAGKAAAGDALQEMREQFCHHSHDRGEEVRPFFNSCECWGGCRRFFSLRDKCVEKLFCVEKNP